jgi:hypothetical protein
MARQAAGPHQKAVTGTLRATGLLHRPAEAPLVELVKSLAAEMDAGGGAGTRADYLSALKDVRRVMSTPYAKPKPPADGSAAGGTSEPAVEAPSGGLAKVPEAARDRLVPGCPCRSSSDGPSRASAPGRFGS